MNEALFFGCWKRAGHFLFGPDGRSVYIGERRSIENVTPEVHLDGGLAPKSWQGTITCSLLVTDRVARQRLHYDGRELPQGKFLRHVLPSGYTAISFWDRNQGDKRGACNSTFLLRGEHTSEVMLAEFRKHFPHVVENLDKAGVALVEVFPTSQTPR